MRLLFASILTMLIAGGCNLFPRPTPDLSVGRIEGTITDSATGEPVVGASVFVKGTRLGAICDEHGKYTIGRVPVGKYTLSVAVVGYHRIDIERVEVIAGQTTRIDRRILQIASDMTLVK